MRVIDKKRGRGRPRKSDETDTRDLLLNVARTIFAEQGYSDASLRAIAAQAGVDVGLIAQKFESKFGLWKAVIDGSSDRILLAIERVIASANDGRPIDRIQDILSHYIDEMCNTPSLAQFITQDSTKRNERFEYIYAKLAEPMHHLMSPIIEHAKGDGLISDIDSDFIFFVLSCSVCMSVASRQFITRYNQTMLDDDLFKRNLKEAIFSMFG